MTVGTNGYNFQLAERRALAVRDYLRAGGIAVERTSWESLGEGSPRYLNDNESYRALNRRVDIVVTAKLFQSLDDLSAALSDSRQQRFTIPAGEGRVISGKAGTRVWIGPDQFRSADGQPLRDDITIVLTEAYSYQNMLGEGLSTLSGGQLLETGGMINLQAMANGRELQLAEGRQLVIGMPTAEQLDGMQLFTATSDPTGAVDNWTSTGQAFVPSLSDMFAKMPPRPQLPHMWLKAPKPGREGAGKPVEPRRPMEPYLPIKPKRSSIRFEPGFFKRMLMGKEKIKEKEEQLFDRKMADYENRLERYHARMAQHQIDLARYERDMETYALRLKDWQKQLSQKRKDFYNSPEYQAYLERYEKAEAARMRLHRQKLEDWQALKDSLLFAYEEQYGEQLLVSGTAAKQYLFQVNQLGWINCDRFYQVPEKDKVSLAVVDEDEQEEEVYIVFKDIRSMMRIYKSDGASDYRTRTLPRQAPIRIVGLKLVNGRAYLAVKDTNVGLADQFTLDYQPSSLKSIRLALSAFDS